MSRVLIADDDRISCQLLSGLLAEWGYQAEVVNNGLDAQRNLMKPDAPRLAILDWMMPGLDGIQVIKAVRAAHRHPYTYLFLLTSKGQKEDLLQGLEAGADDYLKKPFDPAELRARLRAGTRILGLERRLVSAQETTEHQATHDLLTGLYNRTAIVELLGREAARCHREGHKLSVLLTDADHLRNINHTHGNLAGDQAIKQLGLRMASPLRPHDSVGRFGGGQFLILAPNCTLNQAMVNAERLRARVAAENLPIGQSAIAVTVSVGVTAAKEDAWDVNLLLQEADLALHQAKTKGRNRVECFVPSDTPLAPPVGFEPRAAKKGA